MTDPNDLFDSLVAHDVVDEDSETGVVTITAEFERTLGIYADTYRDVSEPEFHRSIADAFGLDGAETAATVAAERGITRPQFSCYLALQSYLPDGIDDEAIGTMAEMVAELEAQSPVPPALTELTDETFEDYVATTGDCIVSVWKRHCDPCRVMKDDLEDVLSLVPEDVDVAGVDGEAVPTFCRRYEVNTAPAFLFFRDGELRRTRTGVTPPSDLREELDAVYGEA